MSDKTARALEIAEKELGSAAGLIDTPEAWSLILTHLVLGDIVDELGPLLQLRKRLAAEKRLSVLIKEKAWQGVGWWCESPASRSLPFDAKRFHRRVSELVYGRVLSEPLSPPTLLTPDISSLVMVEQPLCAAVYEDPTLIENELYILMIDAYSSGNWSLLGTNISSFDNGATSFATVWDEDADILIEGPIAFPLTVEAVIFLSLDLRDDGAAHQKIAGSLGPLKIINPAEPSARCDDKAVTAEILAAASLPIPETIVLSPDMDAQSRHMALTRLPQTQTWICKPSMGTKTRGVRSFSDRDQIAAEVGMGEIELVQEQLRSVRILHPESGDSVPCIVRLHVVGSDRTASVESGYLVAGSSENSSIVSPAIGDRTMPIHIGLRKLLTGGKLRQITKDEWGRICGIAEKAHMAINSGLTSGDHLRLTGIDLILSEGSGPTDSTITATILELNARPAGLAHGTALGTDPMKVGRPTVSENLWRDLRPNQLPKTPSP